jgi:hypothetical protein
MLDMVSYVLLILALVLVIIATEFQSQDIPEQKSEYMTLKTFCDERDRNCIISCTTKDGSMNRKCYDVCKINSPIC